MIEPSGTLRIAVGIATRGRPDVLGANLTSLARQTRAPDAIFLCPTHRTDLPESCLSDPGVTIVDSAHGSCRQRNAILDRCDAFDCVVFLDDDFIAGIDFLSSVEICLTHHPSVVAVSGRVLADGVTGPEIPVDAALDILNAVPPGGEPGLREVYNAYGCNMAIRLAAVRRSRMRFDERLPLYGWLEDVDFSRRLAQFGTIVRCDAMLGVHLGVKSGRTSGLRFGFSQIANPIYLYRKGTLTLRRALNQMARNLISNLARSLWPEPWCDRRGRLAGNALALNDLVRRRLDPRRILDL